MLVRSMAGLDIKVRAGAGGPRTAAPGPATGHPHGPGRHGDHAGLRQHGRLAGPADSHRSPRAAGEARTADPELPSQVLLTLPATLTRAALLGLDCVVLRREAVEERGGSLAEARQGLGPRLSVALACGLLGALLTSLLVLGLVAGLTSRWEAIPILPLLLQAGFLTLTQPRPLLPPVRSLGLPAWPFHTTRTIVVHKCFYTVLSQCSRCNQWWPVWPEITWLASGQSNALCDWWR